MKSIHAWIPFLLLAWTAPFAVGQRADTRLDVPLTTSQTDWPEVDALFAALDSTNTPGVSIAITWDHKPVYLKSYGMADIAEQRRVTSQTTFNLASVTKQFTAYAVLLLAEQGRLSLDDEVSRHVPELRTPGLTVRHLMTQTSGLPHGRTNPPVSTFSLQRLADVVPMYAAQSHLSAEPGARYAYSNGNYLLLSLIVRRVSGRPLPEFLYDEALKPLGMTHTFFPFGPAASREHQAFGYGFNGTEYTNLDTYSNATDILGAGGLYSSIEDLLIWDRAFYARNPAALGRQMEGRLNSGRPVGYGAGLEVWNRNGVKWFEHGGTAGATSTYIAHYPEFGASVIVLENARRLNATEVGRQIGRLLIERHRPASATPDAGPLQQTSTDQLRRLEGRYFGNWNGRHQEVQIEVVGPDTLAAVFFDGRLDMRSTGPGRFQSVGYWAPITLTFEGDRLEAYSGDLGLASMRKLPGAPAPVLPDSLAGYFTAPDLNNGVWDFQARDGTVTAIAPNGRSATLEPIDGRLLGAPSAGLYFEYDAPSGSAPAWILHFGGEGPLRLQRTTVIPGLKALKDLMATRSPEQAASEFRRLRQAGHHDIPETALNSFGYELLRQDHAADGVLVFRLMTEFYPESLNAWDSLADGLVANGQTAEAIAAYERILVLEPNQGSARAALERLRASRRSR